MRPSDFVLAVLFALLMAGQVIASKIGIQTFPPLFLVALRYGVVALCLLPWLRHGAGVSRRALFRLAMAQGAGSLGAFYVGVQHVTAATAAVGFQLSAPLSAVFAWALLRETLGPQAVIGVVLGFAGVVVMAEGHVSADPFGLPLIVLSAALMALGNVLARELRGTHPLALNAWVSLFSLLPLLLLSAALEHGQLIALTHASIRGWAALLFSALGGGILAYAIWYTLLGRHPVSHIAPFGLLQPVFTAALGWLALGEPLTFRLLLGGGLTLAGVAVAQLRRARPVPPAMRSA